MELENKSIEELEARKLEISAEIDSITDIETVEARSAEIDAINAEIESRESAEKQRLKSVRRLLTEKAK